MITFKEAIRTRDFAITAECFLKPETSAESICHQADVLKGSIDAVLLTDNQYGQLHMSTLAAARLFLDNDIDPIVQLSCRNRNRIVLLADILGAAALGVSSLMLVRGNRVPTGFEPRPKAVFDLNATELIATVSSIASDEESPAMPDLLTGGAVTPHNPNPEWQPLKLTAKADAGAQFMMTYICMDIDMLRNFMKHIVAAKLVQRLSIIVSIAILNSAEDARWLRNNRPNVTIPDAVIQRLQKATDPQQEGIAICAEQMQQLSAIPGVAGVNLIASTDLSAIPLAINAAGIVKEPS